MPGTIVSVLSSELDSKLFGGTDRLRPGRADRSSSTSSSSELRLMCLHQIGGESSLFGWRERELYFSVTM